MSLGRLVAEDSSDTVAQGSQEEGCGIEEGIRVRSYDPGYLPAVWPWKNDLTSLTSASSDVK